MTTISLAEAFVDSDREFWHGVLTGGGFTPIPRWTLDPVPGVAGCEAPVPGDLLPALRQRAAELGVPLSSVLLAAHAKVLAALSGESEVVTGYLAGIRGVPLPCRLETAPGSWRAVLHQAHRTEWELLAHQDFPVGDLAGELGLTGPAFETVFDALGGEGALAPGTVLWVSIWPHRGRLALRLRYRTDVLDADAAARIAGYHLTALALIAADPEAEHGRQSLLSPARARLPARRAGRTATGQRPDRRMHELFEQRVRAHPDAIAAIRGDRQWTYAELNARANRLARALLARGLRREGVVAVVTERNLDWMAAVLAIFKAGGVYLPIEPHFPADRIARTLSRAGCELVLTEPGSTATLGPALDAHARSPDAASPRPPTPRTTPTVTSASRSGPISSPTSTSPAAPPASPRARCASTRACSTTCTPRSTTWRSARGRWSRRPRRSASTSRCGSWFPRCWSAGGR